MITNQEILTNPLKAKKRNIWLQNLARRQVFSRLKNIKKGHLTLIENCQKFEFGHDKSIAATITVNDVHFYGEIAFGGSIGAGEAYMLGYWSADNLTDVIRMMAANQAIMDKLEGWFSSIVVARLGIS